jgi:hypothetical protein|tara:strand:- start:35 stop:208 length:174 start_codon:yes stop_codon:yes gene_type:complete
MLPPCVQLIATGTSIGLSGQPDSSGEGWKVLVDCIVDGALGTIEIWGLVVKSREDMI